MMKQILFIFSVLVLFSSCDSDEDFKEIVLGDYPVKEYYLERDPKVNVWGAGLDFINDECKATETSLDYKYMTQDDAFTYDIQFYIVKTYYYDDKGDLHNQGCPTILLAPGVKAYKVGEGIELFNSLTTITEDMVNELATESEIDFASYKDETTGFYEQEALYAALDNCIIGQTFRSGILEVPEGKTEEEVQAVYLVQTLEGGYAKFMVRAFKPAKPNEKKTLVRWQVISE
nr:hypothetical protein [uncultured Carboxylicivirga sp.]